MLDVVIVSVAGASSVRALVDSGCPYNLVDYPIARRIGVSLEDDKWEPITIAGGTKRAYFASVTLQIPHFKGFVVPVGFTRDWEWPYGIVGQRGFFDHFVVTFDRPGKKFALEGVSVEEIPTRS